MDAQTEIEEICGWIDEYVAGAGASGVVVGLSGGIDSSVVACLACEALGPDRVYGVIMPCQSESSDHVLASNLAENLKIRCCVVNLDHTCQMMAGLFALGVGVKNELTMPNTRSRLRMVTLYAFASELGYLVCGTDNKSENMLGYFTKYGDGGVDFNPIGEYFKDEVYDLARAFHHRQSFIIPDEIISRKPTAGLMPGQTDEDELGITYEELNKELRRIAAGEGTDNPSVLAMHVNSKHKREVPPSYPRDPFNTE